MQVVAFLRLAQFRITFAVFVLNRRWRGDQRSVDDVAFAHHQAFLGQVPVDLAREPVGLKQLGKLQQGRRLRRPLAAQVDADENTNGLAVVDRVFDTFIRQTKALVGNVHAQHARQSDRWPTGPFDFRIERLDYLMQFAPRRYAVDLSKETITPRQRLLSGVFEVGEALLHDESRAVNVVLLSQVGS